MKPEKRVVARNWCATLFFFERSEYYKCSIAITKHFSCPNLFSEFIPCTDIISICLRTRLLSYAIAISSCLLVDRQVQDMVVQLVGTRFRAKTIMQKRAIHRILILQKVLRIFQMVSMKSYHFIRKYPLLSCDAFS